MACIVAVILYFILKPFCGIETLSWVCILGAVPFAVLGFVKYNGMTAEKFIVAVIKSEFLTPRKLTFKTTNIYAEIFKPTIDRKLKQSLLKDVYKRQQEHIALKYYRAYHSGSAKTLKSIQVTLAARLEKFNLESMAQLTQTDELDLPSLGEKKVALFAIIPDNDTSFNFLVSVPVSYTHLQN